MALTVPERVDGFDAVSEAVCVLLGVALAVLVSVCDAVMAADPVPVLVGVLVWDAVLLDVTVSAPVFVVLALAVAVCVAV